jgi:hypothetical protein
MLNTATTLKVEDPAWLLGASFRAANVEGAVFTGVHGDEFTDFTDARNVSFAIDLPADLEE